MVLISTRYSFAVCSRFVVVTPVNNPVNNPEQVDYDTDIYIYNI